MAIEDLGEKKKAVSTWPLNVTKRVDFILSTQELLRAIGKDSCCIYKKIYFFLKMGSLYVALVWRYVHQASL